MLIFNKFKVQILRKILHLIGFLQSRKDNEKISEMIQQILISKGFKQTTFKEEEVWKKGNDMIQPAKHFRYYFKGDKVILEGFVTNFGRESGLNGFIGAIPKRGVKKLLKEVEEKVNEFNRQYQ